MSAVAWREHRDRLVRFISGRVADEETAENLVQDARFQAHVVRRTTNERATGTADPAAMMRLEMSAQSFMVLRPLRAIRIRCLRGGVWITQEANRNDIVLVPDDQCTVQGSQRVFLSSFDGARLSIADAVPLLTDTAGVQSRAPALRLDVTRGEFTLSGGRAEARDVVPAGDDRRGRQSIALAAGRIT